MDGNVKKEFIYHPINAYHLIKRARKYLPMLSNHSFIHKVFKNDFLMVEIANCLYQIEEYYHSTPTDMIDGIVQASPTSKKYRSVKGLAFDDVLAISDVAHKCHNYDKEILWLESCMKLSKDKQILKKLR